MMCSLSMQPLEHSTLIIRFEKEENWYCHCLLTDGDYFKIMASSPVSQVLENYISKRFNSVRFYNDYKEQICDYFHFSFNDEADEAAFVFLTASQIEIDV